ncbi:MULTISPECIES: hypothetical protein [Brevibacterium]|uniref:Uncharacterized protein n=1 Tax=Brevibacterium aurantiacum TaxID=273384 RepID=A0A1D7W1H0_BREAU|nr:MULTISPECIES: hypothetical protein [Brevibacterium]AOP52867.1 hypothetical protein BLSMQ_1155 [Brevibacterium aurantiacum]AZL08711.1 hypothetical protein CXR26_05305 [Brevibacterium aurantiacum]AZL12319.1 hypothetical protein CXR25_05475 [Brevibacterium aurantiacum]AZU00136.1 hypothetical protein CXR29_04940 [Brevibacterium linens]PCC50143.1 hypothetical protein CIK62_09680 [Brevibacterium aurantiacum]
MEGFGFVESSFGVLGMLLTLLPVFVFLVIVAGIVIATVWITKYLKRQEADRKEMLDLMRRQVSRKQDS